MIYNKIVGGNMKKNKGFTLIEMLAVITIIVLIFILVVPKITTSLKNKKSDVDKTTENLVLSATKLYVSDHYSKFEKTSGNVYCMPLHQLVKIGYLEGPVKNVTDDKDITNGWSVKITYDKEFEYELVDSSECSVVYNRFDYYDVDGNGYTQVEYLESNGTQYIDTGYKPNQDTRIIADFQYMKNNQGYRFTGEEFSGTMYRFGTSSGKWWMIGYGSQDYQRLGITDTNRHILDFNKNNIYIDNELLYSYNYQNFQSSHNMYIFSINSNSIADLAPVRLYSYKIYDNDFLVRDYVPVKDKNFIGCLFDLVDKKCYYNSENGYFKYPIKKGEYVLVEYLESAGTQYIDTGYKPNQDTRIIADFQYMKNNQGYRFTGEEFSGTMYRFGTSSGKWWMIGYGSQDYQRLGITDTNRHILDFNKNNIYIDNELLYSYNYQNFQSSHNMYIFSINSNSIADLAPVRLYSYKIYDNNTLVRDYIPVIDSSERPCLFDKVSRKYYYNQGTGEFLWGYIDYMDK